MERPESATKVPEAGRRISPARYCTSTRRPRKAEYRAILDSVSETSSNTVNSTKGPPTQNCGKRAARVENGGEKRALPRPCKALGFREIIRLPERDQRRESLTAPWLDFSSASD